MRLHLTAITAVVLAFATTACASTQPAERGLTLALGGDTTTGQEASDAALLDKALESFSATGYRGLATHIPDLRAALDRAPAIYPVIEKRPDETIVRSEDMANGLMLMMLMSGLGEKEGKNTKVIQTRNVYPTIALLLTSDAVERNDHSAALNFADRGLAMQPEHEMLLLEKGAALQGLGRFEEALRLADAALADGGGLFTDFKPAPFHRRRGFSLIELNRLEEAKAAYLTSLETEPDNAAAKKELQYIAELMAGASKTGPVFVNPNAPKSQ